MHFNRTQFATKTHVRLFAVAILILVFLLSACTDGDIEADLEEETQNIRSAQWPATYLETTQRS